MDNTELEELLADRVEVDEVDDRVSFYLANRHLIETWARLRNEASVAVQSALHDLAEPLAEDLRKLGVDPVVAVHGGRYPAIHLMHAEWCDDSGTSPIVVALECDKHPIGSHGDLKEYAAVIAPRGHPLAKAVEPALTNLSSTLRARLGREWKHSLPRWPVFGYLTAPDDPWTVESITNEARSAVLRLWDVAVAEIDRTLANTP